MTEDALLTRLELLDQYLQDLRESQPRNFEAYEHDKMLRRYTERMLQMAAETCIHIGIGILLIVFEQNGVDDMMVYGFLKKHLGDLQKFSNVVRDYLMSTRSRHGT